MKNRTPIQGFNSVLKSRKSSTVGLSALRQLTKVDRTKLNRLGRTKSPSQLWIGWHWW